MGFYNYFITLRHNWLFLVITEIVHKNHQIINIMLYSFAYFAIHKWGIQTLTLCPQQNTHTDTQVTTTDTSIILLFFCKWWTHWYWKILVKSVFNETDLNIKRNAETNEQKCICYYTVFGDWVERRVDVTLKLFQPVCFHVCNTEKIDRLGTVEHTNPRIYTVKKKRKEKMHVCIYLCICMYSRPQEFVHMPFVSRV